MDNKERLLELRNSTGMSRRDFCKYFEIPYRTLQDWELGNRRMPDYLLRLMEYKVRMEKLLREEAVHCNAKTAFSFTPSSILT